MDPGPWGMGTNVKALGSGMKGGQEDPSVAMRGVKGKGRHHRGDHRGTLDVRSWFFFCNNVRSNTSCPCPLGV